MKYIKQLTIILAITFVGEALKAVIPLPIPSSIYGLVLMLALLMSNVLKLEGVKKVGGYFIEYMPIMFLPSAVALIPLWPTIKPIIIELVVITLSTTLIVMVVSGYLTQLIITSGNKSQKEVE